MKANWITFYSYKGGVGRSMALANVAAYLAKKGRRVVLIDFDLEAPGLDSFSEFELKDSPGVVEYVTEFLETGVTPSIGRFVHTCDPKPGVDGALWLMPSGRKDAAYAAKLHKIDWGSLYRQGVAQPFVANWKHAIERAYSPDYVLIDSRTGLTDVGGVCTLHFPDIVVLLFALNRQNLAGTAGVLHAIRSVEDREPIQVVTVASPVPNLARDASNPLTGRFQEAERILTAQVNAVIGYFPSVALEERLWTLDNSFPVPRIAEDYANLAQQILGQVRDGFDFLLKQAESVARIADEVSVQPLIDALLSGYGDRSEAYRVISQLERSRGRRDEGLKALERALEVDPSDSEAFTIVTEQYRISGRFNELRSAVDRVAASLSGKMSGRHYPNWFHVGQCYMMFGEYRRAVDAYDAAKLCDFSGKQLLVLNFNYAEAKRRAAKEIISEDWQIVLRYAEESPVDRLSAQDTANRFQALHVAYAVTGNYERATDYLERAIAVAATLNPTATLFSLAVYTSVSRTEFLEVTMRMREALAKGELWDGMQLPARQLVPTGD